ncbi:hypothetical protein [Microbacterium arborescens]|uniref:hypothetical protein n=1 Tax=Microbacterium arborescens TaxID=33883 RepID=UPI0025A1791D|nr:hypothetical protein [Microbacterium arborescens]WJM17160.1 hypothetical protein QUC20_07630 [Microbacterium arborescens]
MRFLDGTRWPPTAPAELTALHVDDYRRLRSEAIGRAQAGAELRMIGLLFEQPPLNQLVSSEVRDRLRARVFAGRNRAAVSGYSDAELARIIAAARADINALRQRFHDADADADASEDSAASAARRAGGVRLGGVSVPARAEARRSTAERVFATRRDLYPMLVLLMAVTGWNLEVIKELPVEHRVIEGRAVEVDLVKRRRGPGHWHQTVTWEIGVEGRELHTPGGLYLLLHRLMAPARAFLQTPAFWAIWHQFGGQPHASECRNPFDASLDASLRWGSWVAVHDLRADPPSGADPDPDATGDSLRLTANRLKTSIDVRRTRQLGGHLPSAARSNTTAVLFRNYLSGDQTTIEWAREVVSEAFTDVERAAYDAHLRALRDNGGRRHLNILTTSPPAGSAPPEAEACGSETAWTSCRDHSHHPLTGRRCGTSFLDCFLCSNCVVTGDHLPRLLSLLDALETRRSVLSDEEWWARYGPVWAAIHHDVLPKFTEAEIARAHAERPNDSLLDLVEPPWERP